MAGIYGADPIDKWMERNLIRFSDSEEEEGFDANDDVDSQIQDMEDRDADYEFPEWMEP